MTENDYLNPNAIKEQCDAAVRRLEKDNEALASVETALEQFVNDEEIKSGAYDALKQQIGDYKTLIQAMQDANYLDKHDFTVLKTSVGEEVLDGAVILAQKNAAWEAKISDENMASEYERASVSAEWPWVSLYYKGMAHYYEQMVQNDIQLYNEWKAKEDAFDAIEAGTSYLFQNSTQLRQTAQNGLLSITGVFSNGVFVPDMGASWRVELVECYVKNLVSTDANGNETVHWEAVEKVLKKDASEITDIEYEILAEIYLKADEEGMTKFLLYCMERTADIDLGGSIYGIATNTVIRNEDYSEWGVKKEVIEGIQKAIVAKSEELLGQMRTNWGLSFIEYQENKKTRKNERNNALQRLTLISVIAQLGTFRGEYRGGYPMIAVEKGERCDLIVKFKEYRNVGSNVAPVMSNLGTSKVSIAFTLNGESIALGEIQSSELAFKACFCDYSAKKDVAEFFYEEMTGEVIGQVSEELSQYVGKTVGKETVGKAIGAIPFVGDVIGLGVDIALDQAEQEAAIEFVEGQFTTIKAANIYANFDCSVNDVHFDIAQNTSDVLYSYEGELTEDRIERVNVLLKKELGKEIAKRDVITKPNEVYDLYLQLMEKNLDNSDRYDEAVNNK